MRSLFYPYTTQGIKYTGSKLKLLSYIMGVLREVQGVQSVLDGFSGTTRVSQALMQAHYQVIANDISVWSEVFGNCYLIASKDRKFYQEIVDHLNHLEGHFGWFSEHYGGDIDTPKRPFQLKNTMKLDAIRDEIEKLNLCFEDKCVILTSLILALDEVDSTLGHYVAYLHIPSKRSYNNLHLKVPLRLKKQVHSARVIRADIFDTIKNTSVDLAYFDPPYGSNNEKMPPSRVRYAGYYHIWTSVILNDKPAVFGRANRRLDSRDMACPSVFESFKKDVDGQFIAMKAIDQLLRNTQAAYILLSYSSGGRATKNNLMDILASRGRLLKIVEIDYKKNVMSAMKWTGEWASSDDSNKEYLFLIRSR